MADGILVELTWQSVSFLLVVGFIGGLVSGFIGSGGAFVLTPGMMSLGVPGLVAVASNICHKFPKALVGAIKRNKYGQVDVKLGLFMSATAALGMWWGAGVQQSIKAAYGEVGSNLYVSLAFVIVLSIVGGFVMRDALAGVMALLAEGDVVGRLDFLSEGVADGQGPGHTACDPKVHAIRGGTKAAPVRHRQIRQPRFV